MIELIKEKIKLDKWYFFIPVIGTIIYSIKFEFFLNKEIIVGNKRLKIIKRYKSLLSLISFGIAIIFITLFFVYRNKNGYGAWPWFFWVGLGIGLGQNIVPFLPWYLYKIGIKKYENSKKK